MDTFTSIIWFSGFFTGGGVVAAIVAAVIAFYLRYAR